ncbi:MAG: fatty acid desaturase [Bacteroidota bacterium]|nr:fatty acid desaturase [Bacteroidota bacterium]MDP4234299.1 fatty acid desaturase [Bacteroidota bacterium]MDP4243233.1 fatty acid desaturase [Bacteroidota bacterium]MDP4288060.1 fatty acid desaturase [Bacteroidota bacterium]
MLRYRADRRTLLYMVATTGLFAIQWVYGFNPFAYFVYLFLSIAVTVIAHNHNHVPIWRNKTLNALTDYWLTIFYGFPAFAWIPTHNMNHHALNNREGDYTITYRLTEHNHLMMLLAYPSVSSYYQQKPIRDYIKRQWVEDRSYALFCLSQYLLLVLWIAVFAIIDWRKALLYVVVPQQVGLFSVLIFNYVQHVHADEQSKWNHSRNFVGFLNTLLFNNGLHTVHHERAGMHWSQSREAHAKVEEKISPALIERSFWGYIGRNYFLGALIPKYRTHSMRLERMQNRYPLGSQASPPQGV